jgi:hypothetical protein
MDKKDNAENWALLGYYAVCSGVIHYMLHKSPKQCSAPLLHGNSLKSCKENPVPCTCRHGHLKIKITLAISGYIGI